MHEFSIVSNLFSIIEDLITEHDLKKVSKVTLEIGKMRQVVPVAMKMAFDAISEGTPVEGATLEMNFVPITMECRACNHKFQVEENVYLCPQCQSPQLELVEGQELIIKNIEGEN